MDRLDACIFTVICYVSPDPVIMEKLLKESPHSLVKFQVCAKREEIMFNDRRLNRVRNKNRIPFGPWAHSVIESNDKNLSYKT